MVQYTIYILAFADSLPLERGYNSSRDLAIPESKLKFKFPWKIDHGKEAHISWSPKLPLSSQETIDFTGGDERLFLDF